MSQPKQIHFVHDEWKFVTHINLGDMESDHKTLRQAIDYASELCFNFEIDHKFCDFLFVEIVQIYDQLISNDLVII